MSLFGTTTRTSNPFFGDFAPMFRFMDDYASHIAGKEGNANNNHPTAFNKSLRTSFQPKFDVKETKEAYELQGEIPGIEQTNVQIEFTDSQTLRISGRTERFREEASRGAGTTALVGDKEEEGGVEQSQLTEGERPHDDDGSSYHKASVEDDEEVGQQQKAEQQIEKATPTSANSEVTHDGNNNDPSKSEIPTSHYWVSERSVGEFSRTFAFPTRIDQEGVKASLKDGVLSIRIAKAAAPVARRIEIE